MRVLIGALINSEMQFVLVQLIAAEEHVLGRDLVVDLLAQDNPCLVGPTTRDVLDGVSSAAKEDGRCTIFQHVVHAGSMPLY